MSHVPHFASRLGNATLALAAFFLLTAAKGVGCNNPDPQAEPLPMPLCNAGQHFAEVCTSPVPECPPGANCATPAAECSWQCVPGPECAAGHHLEQQCAEPDCVGPDHCGPGPMCEDVCVPDSCPPGTVGELVCGETAESYGPDGSVSIQSSPACSLVCKPAECAPGQHIETVCTQPDCAPDAECPSICQDQCVNDGPCPPNMVAITVCPGGDDPSQPDPGCHLECVEADAPVPVPAQK